MYFKFKNLKKYIWLSNIVDNIKLESKFAIIASQPHRINLYKYRKFVLVGRCTHEAQNLWMCTQNMGTVDPQSRCKHISHLPNTKVNIFWWGRHE